MVSVLVVLTGFEFYFAKPSHACFHLSRTSFDEALSGNCRGTNGQAWKWRINFEEAFFVMLVRFVSRPNSITHFGRMG